jgi:hypothetical protein
MDARESDEIVWHPAVEAVSRTNPSRFMQKHAAKIVRGAIRQMVLGLALGDISSVESPEALKALPRVEDRVTGTEKDR